MIFDKFCCILKFQISKSASTGANIMFDENKKEEGGRVMYTSKSSSDHVQAHK